MGETIADECFQGFCYLHTLYLPIKYIKFELKNIDNRVVFSCVKMQTTFRFEK